MIQKKKDRGITLISVAVTIIVLLILATISINLILEKNGIITRSKEAALKVELEDVRSAFVLAQDEYAMEKIKQPSIINVDFLVEKGYLDINNSEVLIKNIIKNPKTGKGNIESLKDVYVYKDGKVLYYDEDGVEDLIIILDSVNKIKFKKIDTDGYTVLAIDKNGELWGWGNNLNSQINNNGVKNIPIPQKINFGKKVIDCKVLSYGTAVIDEDGNIWTWGTDSNGELGRGIANEKNLIPEQITTGIKFSKISQGSLNLYAIDENGYLYGCGNNSSKQIDGISTSNVTRIKLIDNSRVYKQVEAGSPFMGRTIIALDSNNVVWSKGKSLTSGSSSGPIDTDFVNIKTDVKKIQVSSQNVYLLTNGGEIWCCGTNNYGELGLGSNNSIYTLTKIESQKKYVDIISGDYSIMALDNEGKYWAAGENMYGSLLTGFTGKEGILQECKVLNKINNVDYACIAGDTAFYLDIYGNIFAMGGNGRGQLANGIVDIETRFSTFAMTKTYGNNGNYVAVSTGVRNSMGIDVDGNVYIWGENVYGQCVCDTNGLYINEPKKIENIKAKQVDGGNGMIAIIDDQYDLYTCGYNYHGDLGIGKDRYDLEYSTELVQVMPGTKFSKVSCGDGNIFAIDSLGNLWGWGDNYYNTLGDGTSNQRISPVKIASGTKFKEVAIGKKSAFAIDTSGYLWSTGYNSNGELAIGVDDGISTLSKVTVNKKYSKISSFQGTLVAIDEEGNAYTCGKNANGQLGNGSYNDSNILTQVKNGTKFKACASGLENIFLVDVDGNLWGSGTSTNGQLGEIYYGKKVNTFVKISDGEDIVDVSAKGLAFAALSKDGNIYVGGSNEYCQASRLIIDDDCFSIIKIESEN